MKRIIITTIIMIFCVTVLIEAKEKQTAIEKGKDNSPLGYYEYIPKKNIKNKIPLIIFWHGLGESGNGTNELNKVLKNGIPRLIEKGEKFDAIIISPQTTPWPKTEELVDFFNYILEKYKDKIDSNRIYITGLSMGGRNTLILARAVPDKIAAIVPICPADDHPGDVLAMKNMGIWFFHNEGDNIVNVACSKTWCNALKNAGAMPKLTIYNTKGHDAWSKTYDDREMWKWLFDQKLKITEKIKTKE